MFTITISFGEKHPFSSASSATSSAMIGDENNCLFEFSGRAEEET